MSTGAIVAVVAAVIIVAAIAAVVAMQRGAGSPGLKRRFGPEYERTLARHDGDSRATRRELTERVKRYGGIEQRVLPEQVQERYAARWSAVQSKFVDDPAAAVGSADELIARLAAERGYPAADSPEHMDALSVHHPHYVNGYREVHAATAGGARRGTEDLRKALVSARGMFDDMLHVSGSARDKAAAEQEQEQEQAQEPEAAEPASEREAQEAAGPSESKPVLGKRLAALTGRGRTEAER
ncbi:hypothetical protein NMG29_06380 [Streptomyces cocklensis]|uniref:Secreted protein n=1 Tax=Actinacidiphila cocklensis TaxID=887465 RepID=A0A9W4GPP3_9ACTN|nr:hypothetical protein [Actinacidiphila cocklensis]MDD1057857.1 hypothetical protein [Actinacidiphila cocklensis]CAG6392715.1 conserved hypothetical protein [Actinacidiphila cocklensis]